MNLAVFAFALSLGSLTGCATVRYARLLPLTTNERAKLTCEELDNEIVDAEKFKAGLGWNAENAGSQVLGVLGDFGIGNGLEAEAARESANVRIESCRAAKKARNCPGTAEMPSEEAELAAVAVPRTHPALAFKRWHGKRDPHGCYHSNPACPDGASIAMDDRIEGTGPKFSCRKCAQLSARATQQ